VLNLQRRLTTSNTIGAHSFVKAKEKQIEFTPRRTHLIEKRGVRLGVVPAHVMRKQRFIMVMRFAA
jgi:hypothetical protein